MFFNGAFQPKLFYDSVTDSKGLCSVVLVLGVYRRLLSPI